MARKKISNAPDRHSQRWTAQEDQMLIDSVNAGLSGKQIAKKLDRTLPSVWARKGTLGLEQRINGGIRIRSKAKATATAETAAVQTTNSAMFAEITEVVSKLTKQHGVKATVIVFEG
jgi:hypothetical protein